MTPDPLVPKAMSPATFTIVMIVGAALSAIVVFVLLVEVWRR